MHLGSLPFTEDLLPALGHKRVAFPPELRLRYSRSFPWKSGTSQSSHLLICEERLIELAATGEMPYRLSRIPHDYCGTPLYSIYTDKDVSPAGWLPSHNVQRSSSIGVTGITELGVCVMAAEGGSGFVLVRNNCAG